MVKDHEQQTIQPGSDFRYLHRKLNAISEEEFCRLTTPKELLARVSPQRLDVLWRNISKRLPEKPRETER